MIFAASRVPVSLLSALLAFFFLPTLPVSADPGDTKSFVILHSNDQHGHLLPFSYPSRVAPGQDVAQMVARRDIGGIARRATLVKEIRRKEKNVYLFDAGDCMDGTPFSTEFLGKADYAAMNAVGYDYGVFGNHDFNMTPAQFDELRGTLRFPLLLANVTNKSDGKNPLPPYVLTNWNGLKVAVFGMVTKDAQTYKAAAAAFVVRDPLEVAKELVPQLRKQADLVIAVTHDGLETDRKMAREIPGIDIIVGGHSHTRLPVGHYERAQSPGPADPEGTIIVQDHQWVGELGRLDFTVTEGGDRRWRITRYSAVLLPITSSLREDKDVARVVASYWDKIKDKYATVIGEAKGEFTDPGGSDLEPTNYYLVADVLQAYSKAEFDLENRGGVRAPILAGKITSGDVIAVDPFDNGIFTYTIKGSDLKKVLVRDRPVPSASLHYHLRRDPATREWALVEATLNGKAIEDDKTYRGSANSYFFNYALKNIVTDAKDLNALRRNVLLEYIKNNSPIVPVEDGRLRFSSGSKQP